MSNKRIFAFGCSMTEYGWPTWADAVGHTLHLNGYEYYNFGSAGSGNYYILASMIKANHDFKFTDTDIIMVLWSSWNREDRYLPGKFYMPWTNQGNVLNGQIYDDQFIQRYWSLEHDIIKNITCISAARAMFNISWEGSIPAYENTTGIRVETDPLLNALAQQHHENPMPVSDINSVEPNSSIYNRLHLDGHPSPAEHLKYVERYITPKLGIRIHPDTVDMLMKFDKIITEGFDRVAAGEPRHQLIESNNKIWREYARSFRTDTCKCLWNGDTATEDSTHIFEYLNSWANKPK